MDFKNFFTTTLDTSAKVNRAIGSLWFPSIWLVIIYVLMTINFITLNEQSIIPIIIYDPTTFNAQIIINLLLAALSVFFGWSAVHGKSIISALILLLWLSTTLVLILLFVNVSIAFAVLVIVTLLSLIINVNGIRALAISRQQSLQNRRKF